MVKYLYDYSLGGCLADDMGLGKTLQSIALLSTVYPDQKMPSLVVVPKSLLFNWRNELNKFAPGISYSFFYGSQKNIDEAMKSNIVITTYETVRSSIDIFHTKDFHIIILDESQKIKNLTSALSKSVMKIILVNYMHYSNSLIRECLVQKVISRKNTLIQSKRKITVKYSMN